MEWRSQDPAFDSFRNLPWRLTVGCTISFQPSISRPSLVKNILHALHKLTLLASLSSMEYILRKSKGIR